MHSQELFSILFNTKPAGSATRDLLAGITKKYPYFSAAHYFLLQNTDQSAEGYDKLMAKTALHFDNAFLLNYRMHQVEAIQPVQKFKENAVVEDKVEVVETISPVPPITAAQKEDKIEAIAVPVEENKIEQFVEISEQPEVALVATVEKNEDTSKAQEPKPVHNTEEMIFEPLFATDYFASQGIKLSEEVQTGDKLGKQLKSFTEWLKTMKKVHDNKMPVGNEQVDVAIQTLAEKSNQDAGILTESMAEAYLQQGKIKKAKEILEKLSLFNPAKSAYFAAKIESLAQDK